MIPAQALRLQAGQVVEIDTTAPLDRAGERGIVCYVGSKVLPGGTVYHQIGIRWASSMHVLEYYQEDQLGPVFAVWPSELEEVYPDEAGPRLKEQATERVDQSVRDRVRDLAQYVEPGTVARVVEEPHPQGRGRMVEDLLMRYCGPRTGRVVAAILHLSENKESLI